jgi:hypothetical protein
MNCKKLHALRDGDPPGNPPRELLDHLSAYASGRRDWALTRATREVLRTLPEPPVPPGLAERVFAFDRHGARRRPDVIRTWSLALAAVLLLGIGIGIFITLAAGTHTSSYRVQDGTVMVPAGSMTTVRIALDAAHPLQDVGFVVKIPAGMQLRGHPGEPQVAWNGELAEGRNVLNLQLRAAPGAAGMLETDLHYADRISVLKVRVMAVEDASVRGLVRRWLARVRAD